MPTTDNGHKFGVHYQLPPKAPKKKGQQQLEVVLPEALTDESYEKNAADPDWSPEEATPVCDKGFRLLEGIIESYDSKNGFGLINCSSVNEPIPFFELGVPIKYRPTKKQSGSSMRGQKVGFSYYNCSGRIYADGLRFL